MPTVRRPLLRDSKTPRPLAFRARRKKCRNRSGDSIDSIQAQSEQAPLTPCQLRLASRIIHPSLMPNEKAPSSGTFLPSSLMHLLSGEPMHDLSGVDKSERNPDLTRAESSAAL